ncbi:MAG: hypothetical protein M1837_001622 [Sclerophora amabilis]|nr:MAG: hypothetical protein M1837_001622 [Sclerophora amabilis]
MTSLLAKYVAKTVLGETTKNRFGKEDPYFERVPATRLDGRPSKKTRKRRKALPPGISERDAMVLTKVKRRAYILDMSLFNFCGIRFGWSSVIGIVPGIGDVLDAFMAVMVIRSCETIEGGLPASLRTKMYLNVALDFVIGLIPFAGDLVDALYRCNTRNAIALEEYLRDEARKQSKQQGQRPALVDPSLPEEFDRASEEEVDFAPPLYETRPPARETPVMNEQQYPMAPQGGTTRDKDRTRKSRKQKERGRSWFGDSGARRDRQPDLEMGEARAAAAPPRAHRSSSRRV